MIHDFIFDLSYANLQVIPVEGNTCTIHVEMVNGADFNGGVFSVLKANIPRPGTTWAQLDTPLSITAPGFYTLSNDFADALHLALRVTTASTNDRSIRATVVMKTQPVVVVPTQVGIYGGIYVADNGVSESWPSQNTWYKIAAWSANSSANGVTPSHTNNNITILTAGYYHIEYDIEALNSEESSMRFQFQLRSNNGAVLHDGSKQGEYISVGASATQNYSGAAIVAAAVNDTIELWGRCLTSSLGPAIIANGSLRAFKL